MVKSMTGFGRGEYSDGKRNVTAEIRTVNHRYADITVKMPKRYSFAEEAVKNIVKQKIRRGKAEVSIIFETLTEADITVRLNEPVADQYLHNLQQMREKYGLSGDIDLQLLSSMPDVLKAIPDVDDEDEIRAVIEEAVRRAADANDAMRTVEGQRLAEDLLQRGELIREYVDKIGTRAPLVAQEYVQKLRDRIGELLEGAVEIPEERILTEAAIFADKANITEELVRLDSHMKQLHQILTSSEGPIGKKLDFLVQEMNRETNTIGSKAQDVAIARKVVAMKAEIEKIREQIQNIE